MFEACTTDLKKNLLTYDIDGSTTQPTNQLTYYLIIKKFMQITSWSKYYSIKKRSKTQG